MCGYFKNESLEVKSTGVKQKLLQWHRKIDRKVSGKAFKRVPLAVVGLLLFIAGCGSDEKNRTTGEPLMDHTEQTQRTAGEPIVTFTEQDRTACSAKDSLQDDL